MRVPSGTPSSDITRSISEPLHRSASRCARTCVSCQATVRALGLLRHFPPPAPSQTSLGFLLRSLAGALARPSLLLFPLTQNCCYRLGAREKGLRVVLDTNTVLSAILFPKGRLAWFREMWEAGRITPMVNRATVQELIRVLAYPKFRLSQEEIETEV